jgi:hypothetical protein
MDIKVEKIDFHLYLKNLCKIGWCDTTSADLVQKYCISHRYGNSDNSDHLGKMKVLQKKKICTVENNNCK